MKKIIYFVISILGILTLFYFVFINSFEIFDEKVIKISDVKLLNKSYNLGIYYSASNATVQSNIQIRFENNDRVLQFYEKYNYLKEYKVKNDTLILLLSDTSLKPQKIDSLYFKLP